MITRPYGKNREPLSVIGFGGILVMNETPAEAARLVGWAVDRGINYFDIAPTYGNAEERLGPALAPYRDRVFLACKTAERQGDKAEAELHASLKKLQTDHFDLYQLHGVTKPEQTDRILADDGALKTLIKAREQGLVRNLGFSAHSEEEALRLLDAYPFDSVLFPINYSCWTRGQFGPAVVARALEKGVTVLALKAMARRPMTKEEPRKWAKCWYAPVDTLAETRAALAFTLSRPVTAALTPGHAELLQLACEALGELGPDLAGNPAPDLSILNAPPLFSRGAPSPA
jgi:aryl-alcohol dehydrogenase-like predicted oxidoreductase